MKSNLFSADLQISNPTHRRTLYRILRFEHLVRLFQDRQYTLVSPFLWEDPFEKLWSRLVFKEQPERTELQSRVFGSCLTFQARSDAMWNIYSRNWLGVRITIRFDELKRQSDAAPQLKSGKLWFGEVKYLRDKELEERAFELIHEVAKSDSDRMTAVAKAWLNKRIAFRHEDEMRMLFVLSDINKTSRIRKSFAFTVDPHALVQSIHIDPRAPKEVYAALHREIKENLGFTGSIRQSSLLRLPARLQALVPDDE
jgi:Protein of unknown function (DUF2971)